LIRGHITPKEDDRARCRIKKKKGCSLLAATLDHSGAEEKTWNVSLFDIAAMP
jgi:hypothetical protein